jgi:lysophospholipase L1-like esterase
MKPLIQFALVLGCLFNTGESFSAERFQSPVLVGDSWSNDLQDWPNFTTTLFWGDFRHHAIGGEWLSIRDADNQLGMVLNIAGYLDLYPDADSIIIEGGIGDVRGDVDSDTMKAALASMVAEAKSRANIIDIMVMSPGPFGRSWKWNLSRQAELDDYLNWFPGFCASQHISCYNSYEAVNHPTNPIIISDGTDGSPDYDLDGLHLNILGASKVAGEMDVLITDVRNSPDPVIVDVDPYSAANIVKPESDGQIPVVIYSVTGAAHDIQNFDATQVDPAALRFGPAAAEIAGDVWFADFNGDAVVDALIGFNTQETGILCNDTDVRLFGETVTGEAFAGYSMIDASDCSVIACHP